MKTNKKGSVVKEKLFLKSVGDPHERLVKLEETIDQINKSMRAENFYEGDREEVERSRLFFEQQREALQEQLRKGTACSAH